MTYRSLVAGGVLFTSVTACSSGEPTADGEDVENQEGMQTAGAGALRVVDITVAAEKAPETYESRSYPSDDYNGDGLIEMYKTPIYKVWVDGTNAQGVKERREWQALRFMPYFNNPNDVVHEYRTVGWANSGLSNVPRQLVPQYKPDYEVHNRFSPFGGALVVKGSFYIHAGPADLSDIGWGAAGCVEMIGDFDKFKKDILELAGSTETDIHKGIGALVSAKKLFVQYEPTSAPNLRAAQSRQTKYDPATDTFRDP
jgi:hypothetical protein